MYIYFNIYLCFVPSAVSLKINGFAHTSWSEHNSNENSKTSNSSSKSTHYHGHVDYVNSFTYLLSPKFSGTSFKKVTYIIVLAGNNLYLIFCIDEPVLIEPGIHTFSFACHIPNNCPSSFEGYNGHIRYMVQINLIRPWKFNVDFSKGFTVLKVMNLNYDSPLLKVRYNIMSYVFIGWK